MPVRLCYFYRHFRCRLALSSPFGSDANGILRGMLAGIHGPNRGLTVMLNVQLAKALVAGGVGGLSLRLITGGRSWVTKYGEGGLKSLLTLH